ncbi:MAG: DUF3368 domain-containing protein [Magnetococcales bacterium]|nr:DUF3368 domain-containing protein [Magnetococcales bacterium]MBF0322572.1 DUF3368 domain-containing protein [Magnetococcales bacterium]
MLEPIVINASPLIFLARSQNIHLLQQLHRPVLIPQPVAQEIQARGQYDPTTRALAETEWLEVVPAPTIPNEILSWDLGKGESSVLAMAWSKPDSMAMIDDLTGRRCAQALNIRLIGTLGLVLLAKQKGAITHARTTLRTMREQGMYLSDVVIDAALKLVDESWP